VKPRLKARLGNLTRSSGMSTPSAGYGSPARPSGSPRRSAGLTEAIATGGPLAALVDALKARDRQRADTLARLEHLHGLSRAPEWGNGGVLLARF
jgi:hypothetical protein